MNLLQSFGEIFKDNNEHQLCDNFISHQNQVVKCLNTFNISTYSLYHVI